MSSLFLPEIVSFFALGLPWMTALGLPPVTALGLPPARALNDEESVAVRLVAVMLLIVVLLGTPVNDKLRTGLVLFSVVVAFPYGVMLLVLLLLSLLVAVVLLTVLSFCIVLAPNIEAASGKSGNEEFPPLKSSSLEDCDFVMLFC